MAEDRLCLTSKIEKFIGLVSGVDRIVELVSKIEQSVDLVSGTGNLLELTSSLSLEEV